MERQLTEIIEKYLEGNYLVGGENKTKMISEILVLFNVSKRLSIKLEDWHYKCGDGCCDMYGTEIALNGKVCDNQYAGDNVRTALEFVLTELGYDVNIDVC